MTALTGIPQTCSGAGEQSRCWEAEPRAAEKRGGRVRGSVMRRLRGAQSWVSRACLAGTLAPASSNWLTLSKLLTSFHSQFLQLLDRDNKSVCISGFFERIR